MQDMSTEDVLNRLGTVHRQETNRKHPYVYIYETVGHRERRIPMMNSPWGGGLSSSNTWQLYRSLLSNELARLSTTMANQQLAWTYGSQLTDTSTSTSHRRILYYIILYYIILYYIILYYTILYYTILYYTISYYIILYYIILYDIILYYIKLN